MNESEVLRQSKSAYGQWAPQWREQAAYHGKHFEMKSLRQFANSGIGKAILLVANGFSFEEHIDTIIKYRDNVDIICCDKTLGHLLDHGIKPNFCMLADANVSYEKYCLPWKDQLSETILLANVCGHVEWAPGGNWKDIFFYVNKDVLKSEEEFSRISGCTNFIAAGTNVSNAMIVILTQCDDRGRFNYFGYDKLICIGFDYCWRRGEYYAFNKDGEGKDLYMRGIYVHDIEGKFVYTSNNLFFSAKWIEKYVKTFTLPVVQCSKRSIAGFSSQGDLEDHMKYSYKREHSQEVTNLVKIRQEHAARMLDIDKKLSEISHEHSRAYQASI